MAEGGYISKINVVKGAVITLLTYMFKTSIPILLHITRLYIARICILFLLTYYEVCIFTLPTVFLIYTII